MTSSLWSWVRSWRERRARSRRPSAPRPPYRAAAPPPKRARPKRRTRDALRGLWPGERLRWLAVTAAVGVGSGALVVLLVQCARFASPRVSEPLTHVLAIPFGLFVGVLAGAAILAAGALALAVALLVAASLVHVGFGLVRGARELAGTVGRGVPGDFPEV